jgi:hypothetical protein
MEEADMKFFPGISGYKFVWLRNNYRGRGGAEGKYD